MLALLVGTLIWGAAIDKEIFSLEVKLPLLLEATDGRLVLGDFSDSVLVELNGSGLEMLSYQISSPLSDISKIIPTTEVQSFPASISLVLKPSDVHLQGSVVVSHLQPDQVSFTVDTTVSRNLPVSVLSSDGIPSRFCFVSVEPGFITVTGPSSVVLLMDSVTTEEVSIRSGHVTASLAFSNNMVAYSEELVQVRIHEPVAPAECWDCQ